MFLAQVRTGSYPLLYFAGGAVMYLAPLIIGAFWGAPLVARELEAGTYRVAWNQSVTRTRWLVMKLALGGGAAMLFAGLASLLLTWWAGPIDRVGGFPVGTSQLSKSSRSCSAPAASSPSVPPPSPSSSACAPG